VGGFGGSVFSLGNGASRVLSRFYFMNMVLGMLFLVKKIPTGDDLTRGESTE
jgi:hypothetical protein